MIGTLLPVSVGGVGGASGKNLATPDTLQPAWILGLWAFKALRVGGVGEKFLTFIEKKKVNIEVEEKEEIEKSWLLTPDTPDTLGKKARKPACPLGFRVSGKIFSTPDTPPIRSSFPRYIRRMQAVAQRFKPYQLVLLRGRE
jgi:hypothetical protein